MQKTLGYGLELTCNSKVGWAFSLPRNKTCIGSTTKCRRLCYGNGIRYQSDAQKEKRERNFRTVEYLLAKGGPELLSQNLSHLVDLARPRDWLTAQVSKTKTQVPWSLRIQDLGDFHSAEYARAWLLTISSRPHCSFWFYTRSFIDQDVLSVLNELASMPNCQGWLSADSENFEKAILAKASYPNVPWKLALLQDPQLDESVAHAINDSSSDNDAICFPYHRAGKFVTPVDIKGLTVCPAATGVLKLEVKDSLPKPCQQCTYCLP